MQIDLRNLRPDQRLEQVLPLFEQLPRGRGLTLVSDSSEDLLLTFFQTQRAGEFEWYPLETGPQRWLLVLARRPDGAPRRRQVMEFMDSDHRHIHRVLGELGEAAGRGELKRVIEVGNHLRTSLERHMRMEEEVLLPVVAERMGSPRGPAALLRDEHLQIGAQVERILELARTGPVASVLRAIEELVKLLQHHAGMEERILYAVTDLLLTEAERDALVRRCQRI